MKRKGVIRRRRQRAVEALEPRELLAGVPKPSHVVVVVEENHSYSEIIGSSSASYINSLANSGAVFTNSTAITHPSEPNYLALFSGSTQGVTNDATPSSPFTTDNLGAELISGGYTFDGYSEGMPSIGYTGDTYGSSGYARKHNPWVDFSNIPNGTTAATSVNLPFTSFPSSSNYASLPTVSIVVPTLADDMHDGTIQQGDTWLQNNLSAYANWAKNNNSLLIVTWDEDDSSASNQIPTLIYGAGVKPGQYSEAINHYSVLRTIEDMYGTGYAGASSTATSITDVWATTRLRIVSYNTAADINGVTTPLPGFYENLEGIGEEQLNGVAQPLDILGLEETTSNSTTVAPIVSALNTYYNGKAVYAQSTYQATQSGANNGGNGPNAIVYNTKTVTLLASVGVGTPKGSTNGEYRQVVRYEFQPVGNTGNVGVFYMYVAHSKSAGTSADATARNEEAQIIRNDAATLPAGSNILYTGDFNTQDSSDASYQTLTTGTPANTQGYDPLNRPGNWYNNSSFKDILSDSTASLRYRTDHEIVTSNITTGTGGGLAYVSGTYHSFGNNGTVAIGAAVNNGSNTALNNDLVPDGGTFIPASTLYNDLNTGSDHYPVVADYTDFLSNPLGLVPSIGSMSISPNSVPHGTSAVTLTASNVTETGGSVASVKFYRQLGASPAPSTDALIGTGAQNGTTYTITADPSALASGSYTYYAIAYDPSSVASTPATATLTITTASVPTVAALTVGPSALNPGATTTLTASSVTEPGGTISSVSFYRESNGTAGYQSSDTLLGTGTQAGTSWTLANVSTTGLTSGSYTLYAVATDSTSITSAAASATLTINPSGSTADILGWDTSALAGGANNYGASPLTPTTTGAGISSAVGLTRAGGVGTGGTAAARAWGGVNWASTASAGITGSQYFTFGLTVSPGYSLTLSGFDWSYRRSTSGATGAEVAYSLNGGAYVAINTALSLSSTSSGGATLPETALPAELSNLSPGTVVSFRVIPYGASGSGGSCYVYDVANSTADDLYLTGAATPIANPSTVNFHTATFTANEVDGSATITVDRTGDTTGSSTVRYLAADNTATAGTDYTATTGTLTFAAGQLSTTFAVPLTDVLTSAGTRSLNLALFNPGGTTQTGAQATAMLSITDNAVPAWLSASSAATWNPFTKTLTATGATTILSDPVADEPNVVVNGGVVSIPITDSDLHYHIGGLAESNAGSFILGSLGGDRTEANHRALIIGTVNPATLPPFSLDSTSTLDLTDNDLILTHPASMTQYPAVKAALQSAYDANAWDKPGLTSSLAAAANRELGYGEASTLGITTFDNEPLGNGAVIVKYTLPGDTHLTGSVGLGDYTAVVVNLGSSNVGWTEGNFDYSSTVTLGDYTTVILNLGQSLVGTSVSSTTTPTAAVASQQVKAQAVSTATAAAAVQTSKVHPVRHKGKHARH